ncbi:MAG: leucine-rich repeat protein [Lachnospiraceae bacterium]|nr:leucine-rich repeat protein [Lachnospiraceae bacterium]
MKRFTSILCALCLIVGVLSGVALAPAEEVKASQPLEDQIPGIITVADFSDPDKASAWNTLSEVKVISGSAITINADPSTYSVGGKSQWVHGIVIIEPQNDWSFTGASYHRYGSDSDTVIETDTLSNVFETLKANAGGESNLPNNIKQLIQSYNGRADSLTGAVIIRSVYAQSEYFTFSFAKTGSTQSIKIKVNPDESYVDKTYNYTSNQEIDVFAELDDRYQDVLNNENSRSDYSFSERIGSHTPMSISLNWSDTSDANYGKFTVSGGAGQRSYVLTNNKSGVSYVLNATFVPASMPLHIKDFTFSSEVDVSYNGTTEDLGDYYLTPKNGKAFSEFSVSFNIPDGTIISKVFYEDYHNDISKNNATTIEIGPDWDDPFDTPRNVTAVYTVENSKATITVRSINEKVALNSAIGIQLQKNGEEFTYSISMEYKRTPQIGGLSRQRIPVAAGSTLRLEDLLYIKNDTDKQLLYEGITNGTIALSMQGVVPVLANGRFNGLLKVYYPCDRIRVWDKEINATITACGADIFVNASTLIEAGTVLDIDSLLPGYSSENKWDSKTERINGQNVTYKTTVEKVNHSYDYTLSQGERSFTAPDNVAETVEYVIHAYKADIRVKVCPKGTLASSLTEVVKDVKKDESLVVDAEKAASLSKDAINNFKNNGGENSSLILKAGNYEWSFGKKELANAAQSDIDLSVKIGDELTNSRLDKVSGVKLGFAANGTLPGKTGFRCYLSDELLKKFKDINHVGLFYDDGSSSLKREGSNYYVSKDTLGRSFIDIFVTHNSDFVLTSVDADSINVASESSGGSGYVDSGSGSGTSSGTTETTPDTDKESTDKAAEEKDEDKNTVVTENEDGSVTKTTVTENEDGTKTTVDTTEFKDGSKAVTETTENADGTESTKTTVTDENGKFYSETVTEESVTKKGTKVEESTTTYADGSTEYTEKRTTKSGKVEETTVTLDKSGKGTASVETTKADGTTESQEFSISKSGVVRIKAFETDGTKATVPESVSVDGKEIPVTIIGKNAFAGTDVEKVTVGSNITTIGVGAFSDAASLKSIVFKAANITKIYKGAFDGIAEDAVIKITASSRKEYNRLVKLIKKSGIAGSVKFKRVK